MLWRFSFRFPPVFAAVCRFGVKERGHEAKIRDMMINDSKQLLFFSAFLFRLDSNLSNQCNIEGGIRGVIWDSIGGHELVHNFRRL